MVAFLWIHLVFYIIFGSITTLFNCVFIKLEQVKVIYFCSVTVSSSSNRIKLVGSYIVTARELNLLHYILAVTVIVTNYAFNITFEYYFEKIWLNNNF